MTLFSASFSELVTPGVMANLSRLVAIFDLRLDVLLKLVDDTVQCLVQRASYPRSNGKLADQIDGRVTMLLKQGIDVLHHLSHAPARHLKSPTSCEDHLCGREVEQRLQWHSAGKSAESQNTWSPRRKLVPSL